MPNAMKEVFDAIESAAERCPGAVAFASRGGYMNYEDFVGNIASAGLAALGVGIKPGQLVALVVASPNMAYILTLALLRLGCRVGYSSDLSLYDDSGVVIDAVIADADAAAAANIGRAVIPLGPDWFKGAGVDRDQLPPVAADGSLITASSGSTGRPKLIETPAQAILLRLRAYDLIHGVRLLILLADRTIRAFCESIAVHMKDGALVQAHDRRSLSVLETIQLFRPDMLTLAPAALADLLKALDTRPMSLHKVRSLRTAGAYFAPHLQSAALERVADEVISVYGAAEIGWVALGDSDQVQRQPRCVGKVVDWLDAAAFDGAGNRLPPGAEGEIRVRPPDVAIGVYLGDPADRPNNLIDGWFVTGDIGIVDEDNNLIIRGRASNVINVGGNKLDPEDYEAHVIALDKVSDVGVTGVDGDDGFQEVCAAIVSKSPLSLDEINAHLHQRKVYWPVQVMRSVAAIPRTQNGKIDRIALKHLCAEEAG